MTTTPTPPMVPPDDDDERVADMDSAEADRLASRGMDPAAVEERAAEPEPSSADDDYAASMGVKPETD